MSQETIRRPVPRAANNSGVFRLGAVIVLALAVAIILFLVLRNNSNSNNSTATSASLATAAQIESLAASTGHPVFWLGPKPGLRWS